MEIGQTIIENKDNLKNAQEHIKILKLLREEFKHLLQFWTCINDYISTYIEINVQAKSFPFCNEIKPKDSENTLVMENVKKNDVHVTLGKNVSEVITVNLYLI